jgi:hypothetical protein
MSTAQVATHRDTQDAPQWPQRNLGGFILSAWAPDPPSGIYLGDILRWEQALPITVRRLRPYLFSGDQPFPVENLLSNFALGWKNLFQLEVRTF